MNGLRTRLTTSMRRKRSLWGIHLKEEYLCNKMGLKRGESICSKGAHFRELTVYNCQQILPLNSLVWGSLMLTTIKHCLCSIHQQFNVLCMAREGLPLHTTSCNLVTLNSAIVISLVLLPDPPQCVYCTKCLRTRLPFHMQE